MKRHTHTHHFLSASTHKERVYSVIIGPLMLGIVIAGFFYFFPSAYTSPVSVSIVDILHATGYTLVRLIVAYILALVCAIPLAYIATYNKVTERIFLPLFDILESVPILAFFPLLILFFVHSNMLNSVAVFILFISMLWNIVFTIAGGIKIIPRDIVYASKVFGITGLSYMRRVFLPAVLPEMVTGSILAFAQGWNIVIVAEVIHTYIPHGRLQDDLYGIGSMLVHASSAGDTTLFVTSMIVMIIVIALINYFVWQNLIRLSERFKFE